MSLSPEVVHHIILVLTALVVGSFLNVAIWRLPREESVVFPSSHCPLCSTPIRPIDNIPVLSWFLLGGKCRGCGGLISARYPIVEALNALMWSALYARFGMGWHLLFYLVFGSALIVVVFVDMDHQIIPDEITLWGLPVGLMAGAFFLPDAFKLSEPFGWSGALIGAAVGFGIFYLIAWASRGGMGGGDIKLMALAGSIVGWKGVLLTTFVGSFAGSIYGLYLIMAKGGGRKTKVPFGPFLVIGILATLFMGQEILAWYMSGN